MEDKIKSSLNCDVVKLECSHSFIKHKDDLNLVVLEMCRAIKSQEHLSI
jgi:hypothetical protein